MVARTIRETAALLLLDRFMDDIGQLPPGPPDPDKFRDPGEKYGQEVVGPPLAVSLALAQRA